MLLERLDPLDRVLETHAVELGDDFTAYRNHAYRVVNFCVALAPCDDWVDVSLGALTFGLPRARIREIRARWPNAGFHQRLARLLLGRLRTHPLTPIPVLKW